MSFAIAWLDLREPADRAARDPALLAAAAEWLGEGLAADLGAGTGALRRAWPGPARWRLADRDAALLAEARRRAPAVETVAADLADLGAVPLEGVRMATCSALLDLVSQGWIERLADRLAAAGIGFYAALSYDGRMEWDPPAAEDGRVVADFNADQRRDKGFGPALGPEAGPAAAQAFAARGYAARLAPSPWRLEAGSDLGAALAAGVAEAAGAETWGQARIAAASRCVVGHWDLLALPPNAQSKTTSVSSP